MPEITITIGGKPFTVACQAGEESYLRTAAAMLDHEASALVQQIGRIPDARMLLMSGLMLADRTAAFEERALAAEAEVAKQAKEIDALRRQPPPEPQRIEVPVVPDSVLETFSEVAARAEAMADQIEEKATAGFSGDGFPRSGPPGEGRIKPAV